MNRKAACSRWLGRICLSRWFLARLFDYLEKGKYPPFSLRAYLSFWLTDLSKTYKYYHPFRIEEKN
jgi:hypothetical protein